MTGLMELLAQVEKLWREDRKKLLEIGEKITEAVKREGVPVQTVPAKELLEKGAAELLQRFDRKWGGFGIAPKFPTPHNLLFLLRYGREEDNAILLAAVEKTLEAMAQGGMFDHIGGGFSRYSTDEKWLVPHFEKMLYDNALLAYVYLEGYRQTGKPFYRDISERTLNYVLRELTDAAGGFYCGQDADSDGVEGKYYIFKPEELEIVLGGEAEEFCQYYHITKLGNFDGRSIPNRLREQAELRTESIVQLCEKVYEYRKNRTALHKDDKILAAWNGLMIAAFAKAGFLTGNAAYTAAAEKAAAFIRRRLTDENGRLFLRYREGEAAIAGQLDDYAFLSFGSLELYQTTFETNNLAWAEKLAEMMLEWFIDEKGGLYQTAKDGERLIRRPKETYDGAMPSGNSVAGYVFAKLAALTGKKKWIDAAGKQHAFLAGAAKEMPSAHCFGLFAISQMLYPSMELICVSATENPSAKFLSFLREGREMGLSVLFKSEKNADKLEKLAPFTGEYPVPAEGEVYYLCRGQHCFAPQRDLQELHRLMEE